MTYTAFRRRFKFRLYFVFRHDCLSRVVARLAGDEFVVIIDGFKATHELSLISRKIEAAIRKPIAAGDMTMVMTTSIGITLVDQRDAFASAIMQRAGQAPYVAKKAGRDRFHVSVSDDFNKIGWDDASACGAYFNAAPGNRVKARLRIDAVSPVFHNR